MSHRIGNNNERNRAERKPKHPKTPTFRLIRDTNGKEIKYSRDPQRWNRNGELINS